MAVETASFNEHGGNRTQESFKSQNWPLKDIAAANSVATGLLKYAKAVWDAAEDAGDRCLHVAVKQDVIARKNILRTHVSP